MYLGYPSGKLHDSFKWRTQMRTKSTSPKTANTDIILLSVPNADWCTFLRSRSHYICAAFKGGKWGSVEAKGAQS